MGKEKIKNKKGALLLVNKLGKFERLNQEEEKILINRTVRGLAPVQLIPRGRKLTLMINVTGWTPLGTYMATAMDGETVLSFIWNTLRIAYDCERFGLRVDNLCWDPGRVFVDPQGTVIMVYWPVTTLEQSAFNPLNFYYGFCGLLSRSGIDQGSVEQYNTYFYQRSYFDFQRFYQMVSEIVERWRRCRYAQKKEDRQRREQEKIHAQRSERQYRISGVWLENADKGENLPLDRKQTRLGRDDGQCDAVISGYEGVSRRHAVISSDGGRFFITDLGSSNGTFVRGRRIEPYQQIPLNDRDKVRFGNARYIFRQTDMKQTVSIHQLLRK